MWIKFQSRATKAHSFYRVALYKNQPEQRRESTTDQIHDVLLCYVRTLTEVNLSPQFRIEHDPEPVFTHQRHSAQLPLGEIAEDLQKNRVRKMEEGEGRG